MAGEANAIKERDEILRKMTPEQVMEAKRLAKEFSPKKAAK
jgi:hypothetical protein